MTTDEIDVEAVYEAFKSGQVLTQREFDALMVELGGIKGSTIEEEIRRKTTVPEI